MKRNAIFAASFDINSSTIRNTITYSIHISVIAAMSVP